MSAEAAPARLRALTRRYGLGAREQKQLRALLGVLGRDEHAPTAVRSPERAVDVHIADSLVALELEVVRAAGAIADIGTGAGLPGLALAVALPTCDVRLVESHTRTCAFLRDLVAEVGAANARVVCARVEQWADGTGAHDVVVARAVAGQPVVLEYAAPLLRLGGTLVDWRGRRQTEQEHAALSAAERLGMSRIEVRRVEPFDGARDHNLHLYVKVEDTPRGFPRRAGMARKRPLGG